MPNKAVIMAGGEGTRLRPLTDVVPKPFLPVAGRPAMQYGLDALVRAGFQEILVTTYYRPERLIEHLGGGARFGARLFYSVEDDALGTAGGVAKARSWLDDTFIVMSGDVLADVDLAALMDFHRKSGALATMALTEVEDPRPFGVVETDAAGRITRFQEKPETLEEAFSNRINAGIYVLEPEVLDHVPDGKPFDFSRDLFPTLLDIELPLYANGLDGVWVDVGQPPDLLRASRLMADRHHGGAYRHAKARVGEEAVVTRSDIYEDARVLSGATVEDSVLYAGAHVAEGAVVKNSLIGPGAVIAQHALVEDAVVGPRARVESGARAIDVRVATDATFTQ